MSLALTLTISLVTSIAIAVLFRAFDMPLDAAALSTVVGITLLLAFSLRWLLMPTPNRSKRTSRKRQE